jgi:hypothetical protein
MKLQEQILRIQSMMGVINEKLEDIQGQPLYHRTSTSNGLLIMESNTLKGVEPRSAQKAYDKQLKLLGKNKYISFTRNKNWYPENINDLGAGSYGSIGDLDMTFVIDKEKLKTKYIVEPFDFNGLPIKNLQSGKDEKNFEYEERVLADEIYPLHKYLIDIIYTGNDSEIQNVIDNYLKK